MMLTEIQIILINQKLQGMGLDYHPLQDELLDHVCCMIEHRMNLGEIYA